MKTTQKFKIVRIGKADAFYADRVQFIGQTGQISESWRASNSPYISCYFTFDEALVGVVRGLCFHKVLLKKLPPLGK